MRLIALALVLTLGTLEAHADLVTYNMTGTLVGGTNSTDPAIAVGDRIAWTLQYDRSWPGGWIVPNTSSVLFPPVPVLSQVVDLTTGTHFYSPANTSGFLSASLNLEQAFHIYPSISAYFTAYTGWGDSQQWATAGLAWTYQANVTLPSVDLAKVQLSQFPWSWSEFNYEYGSTAGDATLLYVQPDPLSVSTAPEPGSLTLLVLGVLVLAARHLPCRLGQAG